jgi:hypothetical protein
MATKPIKMTIEIDKGWSTHMPVLLQLLQKTDGSILEVGSGVYSTPLLHWFCSFTNRKLVTYESDKSFIHFAKQYETDFHKVHFIENYQNIPLDYYTIALIDHNGHDRGLTAIHLKDNVTFIVLHDSNVIKRNSYDKAFPNFKWRKDFTQYVPWTTILSNSNDLANV